MAVDGSQKDFGPWVAVSVDESAPAAVWSKAAIEAQVCLDASECEIYSERASNYGPDNGVAWMDSGGDVAIVMQWESV